MSVLFGGSLSIAAPGGGGAPPGIATIWPSVADWAALSTVAGPLRDGDQVFVQSLGSPASTGLARWDDGDAQWALMFGMFVSFADMEAFAEPIVTGALAGVQESANDDETAVRYQWEAGWARTANGQPYVWESTDPAAVANTDPSGIGVTRVGDILTITTSVGTETLRLYSFADGDTPNATARLAWVDASLPTTGLVLAGYFTGAETADSQLTTQGADTIVETNGAIVYTGTRVSFECTAGANRNVQAQYRTGAVATTARVYTRGLYRCSVGAGGDATTSCVANFGIVADGTNAARVYASSAINATAIRCVDGSQVLQGAADSSLAALPGLAGTDQMVTVLSETATGLVRVRRNGRLECSARRNQGTLASQRISVGAFTSASATNAVTQQVRHYIAVIVP
jgi:hypothetical protein